MVKHESNCNGCTDIGLPCTHCGFGRKRAVVYCDICGHIINDSVYNVGGEHFCKECLLEHFYKGEAEDFE